MLKKKISLFCFAVAFAVLLTAGCGRKQAADLGGAPSEAAKTETAAVKMERSGTNQGDEEAVPEEEMDQSGPGIEAVESEVSTGAGKKGGGVCRKDSGSGRRPGSGSICRPDVLSLCFRNSG